MSSPSTALTTSSQQQLTSARSLSYTDITRMVVDSQIVPVADCAASRSQHAAVDVLRAKMARKLEEFMKEATSEMETINKHARLDREQAFTIGCLRANFPDLFLQQVEVKLKGYAPKDYSTGTYPLAVKVDKVPKELAEFASDDDDDDDDEFLDETDKMILSMKREELRKMSSATALKLLEATSDGKRFKAGVLKIAKVKLVIATRNTKDFCLMVDRDTKETDGGFSHANDAILNLALAAGKLDHKFKWRIHFNSSAGGVGLPFSRYGGVVEGAEYNQTHTHMSIRTQSIFVTIADSMCGRRSADEPFSMIPVDAADEVDAVIFAPTTSGMGRPKVYSHLLNKPYPLIQSKRRDDEDDDEEDM